MRENIVIKREDENLKYIVIGYGYKQISIADILDEYEKMANAIQLIEITETYVSELVKLSKTLKSIRSKYEDDQNA